tara:strand:- start:11263 stop:13953 length:2691 start_codon:yes stop_codon:yes gene_type:complete
MKKSLVVLGVLLVSLLGILIAVPILFKEDAKKAVDDAIAEQVNAHVFYDQEGFSLSLFENFPNFTFSMKDFGVSGIDTFASDTLIQVASFEITLDLLSVISGEQIMINEISLKSPEITILSLSDGQNNYDIFKETTDNTPSKTPTEEELTFSLAIKKWQIIDGNFTYDDLLNGIHTSLLGINHIGSGDFSQDIFDLMTKTTIVSVDLNYEGTNYLKEKTFDADLNMKMNLPDSKYTFSDNSLTLGALSVGLNGDVILPADSDMVLDIEFQSLDMSIKSILSLLPGDYSSYLENVSADGEVGIEGKVSGVYNELRLPDININAMIFNGYLAYQEYPLPIEEIQLEADLVIPGVNMDLLSFSMPHFSMQVESQDFQAQMEFNNLANYTWDLNASGGLDLGKIFQIIPVEGMDLKGLISGSFETSGNMLLIEEEKYEQLSTKGRVQVTDFSISDETLPVDIRITEADLSFDNEQIALTQFKVLFGESDLQMTGTLENFIGYALEPSEVLHGKLNFNAKILNLNPFLTATDTSVTDAAVDTAVLEIIRIPINIDVALNTQIGRLLYDNLEFNDMEGKITMSEGIAQLDNLDFNLLAGGFLMSGFYNSNPPLPLFNFNFKISSMSIKETFSSFNTIQEMAPMAKDLAGVFSTEFVTDGVLDTAMMPVMESLFTFGLIDLESTTYSNPKFIKGLNKITGDKEETLKLQDINFEYTIEDGTLIIEPFDFKLAGRTTTVYGSSGISGIQANMDYTLETDLKTGNLGAAANNMIASLTGLNDLVAEEVRIKIKIERNYEDPQFRLDGISNTKKSPGDKKIKDLTKERAKNKLKKQQKLAEKKIQEELDKQKAVLKVEADKKAAALKLDAEKKGEDIKEEAKEVLTDQIKSKLGGKLKGLKKKDGN